MEKRSRRRIRDLVAPAAFQGLSQNEIGCARISMMARSTNATFKGRIQKRKTNHLQIITFGLQRTAGPYKGAITGSENNMLTRWNRGPRKASANNACDHVGDRNGIRPPDQDRVVGSLCLLAALRSR